MDFDRFIRLAPNLAVLAFLLQPAIALLIVAIAPTTGLRPGVLPATVVAGLLSFGAAGVLAARLRQGPMAAALGVLGIWLLVSLILWVLGDSGGTEELLERAGGSGVRPSRGGGSWFSSMNVLVFPVLGTACSWIGHAAFHRELRREELLGWAREGLALLLREGRFSLARLIGGVAACLLGVAVLPLTLPEQSEDFAGPTLANWIVRFVLIGGLTAIGTTLKVPEDEGPPAGEKRTSAP